jgi:molybdopterin-guanine dinucleotide biosynthesis protein A
VIAGLALAGGRSSRFGSDKAVAMAEGRPMLARVLDRLRAGCDLLAVSAPPGSAAAALAREMGVETVIDDPADPEGPLAGVHAGLRWAAARGAERLLTAPCDTPYLPADYAARLLGGDAGRPQVAVAGGEIEPLCACWPVSLTPDLAEALRAGHPGVGRYLAALGAEAVRFEDAAGFRNVNRPADLA